MAKGEADRRLAPWLAIACLAGADLPELAEPLADLRTFDLEGGRTTTEAEARACLAAEICPRARWAPLLAKARDAALDRAEASLRSDRLPQAELDADLSAARALRDLADAFSACPNGRHPIPAYQPKELTP